MPARFYTNSRVREATLRPTSGRAHPRITRSGSEIMPLTEREREARRQERLLRSAGAMESGNTALSSNQAFFSAQLSTDFLELPQSLREKRELYRHFYNSDEIVAQSIDLHTELPLSKVRLAQPKPRTCPEGFESPDDYGKYILTFFEKMCRKVRLFQRLITAVHHYWLDGTTVLFAEDSEVEVPQEVGYERQRQKRSVLLDNGSAVEEEDDDVWVEKTSREEEELAYYQKHYQGWERLVLFPMDQIKVTTLNYSDKVRVELIPTDRDRALMDQAATGDEAAQEMVEGIPHEIREFIHQGKLIPLGTDPDEGSFCYLLMGRQGVGDDLGQSILDRCHLPGTAVVVRRQGQVLQVAIESLDPDTDQVLSHRGRWQDFELGARVVNEDVTVLRVAKLYPPIVSTSDHKYPVLREGEVVECRSGSICPGDYLQVAQVPLTETLKVVDLAEFLEGASSVYQARRSGNTSDLRLSTSTTDDSVTVTYERGETDPRKHHRFENKRALLQWAAGLDAPVVTRSSELCSKFGLTPITLKELRKELAEFGYYPTVLKDHRLRFEPFVGEIPEIPAVLYEKTFSRWLPLDEATGYFVGYWLGDGYVSQQPGLDYGTLGISYGPGVALSRVSLEEGVKPFLQRCGASWGTTEKDGVTSGSATLFVYHDALVRWIAGNFGHTCEDKALPAWIFDAPRPFLLALLRGFVDSDGDVTEKDSGTISVRMNTTNQLLADQIFLLCASLGYPVSKTQPTKPRMVRQVQGTWALAQPCYSMHFSHGPSVKEFFNSGFLAKRRTPEVWKDGLSGSRHRFWNGHLFYRVQEVDSLPYEGPVYSLNVHEDHTFFAGMCCSFNCLRTLLFREKLRQAQTQIASRAMTPRRIVWAEDISEADVDALREQVDLALVDPDYTIVTNYEVHWEEMGSRDRLLDLSTEYEQTERRLRTGLGVTESLLSGETLYSGDRLKLEVINQRYLFLREILQEYVEEYLFKPVARRKGFIEKDKWGDEVVLYPHLSFTRLPLRDSQDTYDALFNLYQKGSIPVDLILEMFNIDPYDTKTKLEHDLFTVNDAVFNEVMRGIYGALGNTIAEQTDVSERVVKYLGLKTKAAPPAEEEGRF